MICLNCQHETKEGEEHVHVTPPGTCEVYRNSTLSCFQSRGKENPYPALSRVLTENSLKRRFVSMLQGKKD